MAAQTNSFDESEPVCNSSEKLATRKSIIVKNGVDEQLSNSMSEVSDGVRDDEKLVGDERIEPYEHIRNELLTTQESGPRQSPCLSNESKIENATENKVLDNAAVIFEELDVQLTQQEQAGGSSDTIHGEDRYIASESSDGQGLNQFISEEDIVMVRETCTEANVKPPMIMERVMPSEASIATGDELVEEGEDTRTFTPLQNCEAGFISCNKEESNIVASQTKDGGEAMAEESFFTVKTSSLCLQSQVDGELRVSSGSKDKGEESCCDEKSREDVAFPQSSIKVDIFAENDDSLAVQQLEEVNKFTETEMYITNSQESKEFESEKAAEVTEENTLSIDDDGKNYVLVENRKQAEEVCEGNTLLFDVDSVRNEVSGCNLLTSEKVKDLEQSSVRAVEEVIGGEATSPVEAHKREPAEDSNLKSKSRNSAMEFTEEEMHKVYHAQDSSPFISEEKTNYKLEILCENHMGSNIEESQLCFEAQVNDEREIDNSVGSVEKELESTSQCIENLEEARGVRSTGKESSVKQENEFESLVQPTTPFNEARGLRSNGDENPKSATAEAAEEGFSCHSSLLKDIREEAENDGGDKTIERCFMAENNDGHRVENESRTCNNHLEVAERKGSLERDSGNASLEEAALCLFNDIGSEVVTHLISSDNINNTGDPARSATCKIPSEYSPQMSSDETLETDQLSGHAAPFPPIHSIETYACGSGIEEIHQDEKGDMIDSVEVNVEILPSKSVVIDEAISPSLKKDKHDEPEKTAVENLVEVAGVRTMGYEGDPAGAATCETASEYSPQFFSDKKGSQTLETDQLSGDAVPFLPSQSVESYACSACIEELHSGESMLLKAPQDEKRDVVDSMEDDVDALPSKSVVVDEAISPSLKNEKHDEPEKTSVGNSLEGAGIREMGYEGLLSNPFSVLDHEINHESIKGSCESGPVEAKDIIYPATVQACSFGGDEKETEGPSQNVSEVKCFPSPRDSVGNREVCKNSKETENGEMDDSKDSNIAHDNSTASNCLKCPEIGIQSNLGCEDGSCKAENEVRVESSLVSFTCQLHEQSSSFAYAFNQMSSPNSTESTTPYIASLHGNSPIGQHIVDEEQANGDRDSIQGDASRTKSDCLASGSPEDLQSLACDVGEVADVDTNIDHGKSINSDALLEFNGDQGSSGTGQQNIIEEQVDTLINIVIENHHLESERPECLQGSSCNIDGMDSAPEHTSHGENKSPAFNGSTEELASCEGTYVQDEDKNGNTLVPTMKEVDMLPPKPPVTNETSSEVPTDMHESPESGSDRRVLDVSGLKEMLQEVPSNNGPSTLNQETSYEGVEGKSVDISGAKDDGASTSMDQHFSEPSEMGTESDLDGRNHNNGSNEASAISALTCHEMDYLELKSPASAGIEALHGGDQTNIHQIHEVLDVLSNGDHGQVPGIEPIMDLKGEKGKEDNEENRNSSHIEDCMFSSWEIDLIWGDMAKDEAGGIKVQASETSFSNEFEDGKIARPQNHVLEEELVAPRNRLSDDGDRNEPTNKMSEMSIDIEHSNGSFNVDNSDEVAGNKTTMSAMTKRKNSRSILIHGTPRKLPLISHDMKENIQVPKRVEMVDVTAVKPMVKRKALEELHK